MANGLSVIASTPVCGLATQTFTVPTAGFYTVTAKYFVPCQASGTSNNSSVTTGGSSLQVLLKLNGTTKLTIGGAATDPTPTQPFVYGSVIMSCSASDSITVVPSSSAAVDNQLNSVTGIINIYQGQ